MLFCAGRDGAAAEVMRTPRRHSDLHAHCRPARTHLRAIPFGLAHVLDPSPVGRTRAAQAAAV